MAAGQLQRIRGEESDEIAPSLQTQLKHSAAKVLAAAENVNSNRVFTDHAKKAKLEVPVIDLTGLASGDAASRKRIVREITEACETWGMFQVVNHGVHEKIFQDLDKEVRKFFALPMEVKERASRPGRWNLQQQGYIRRLQPDPMFNAWRETWGDDGTPSHNIAMFNRIWPDGNAPLIEAFTHYWKKVEQLGISLMEVLAEGLGLESNFFSQHMQRDFDQKRIFWRQNMYPPRPQKSLTLGLTAHSDPNLLSLVKQDGVCGLQAKKGDGDEWVDLIPIPEALVVNVGDSLEAWSNGRFHSVVHRVVVQTKERLSGVFLLTPPSSLVLQAPPELIDDEHPQLFQPITFDEIWDNLFKKTMAYRNSGDTSKLIPKKIFYEYALLRP